MSVRDRRVANAEAGEPYRPSRRIRSVGARRGEFGTSLIEGNLERGVEVSVEMPVDYQRMKVAELKQQCEVTGLRVLK